MSRFRFARRARCRKRRVLFNGEAMCALCGENSRREAAGLCTSMLWHGPGHQSHTYCRHKIANHPTTRRGSRLHSTTYHGDIFAEWTGRRGFTGYFDEPPNVE